MASTSVDRVRITARVPAHVHDTLETAASPVDATLNQCVVQSVLREAERVIEQERVIRLGARDSQAFLDALAKPLPPNAKLSRALRDHLVRRDDRSGGIDWAPRPKSV